MENDNNENWINKLVDEFIDAKEAEKLRAVDTRILTLLTDMILDESALSYSSDNELRISGSGEAILAFIKAYDYDSYISRVKELQGERETEEA